MQRAAPLCFRAAWPVAAIQPRLAGILRWERPAARSVLRCLTGGAMMGFGAMLVPGSNDGLIMLGLPLMLPHAWVAVSAMALTIAAAVAASSTAILNRSRAR